LRVPAGTRAAIPLDSPGVHLVRAGASLQVVAVRPGDPGGEGRRARRGGGDRASRTASTTASSSTGSRRRSSSRAATRPAAASRAPTTSCVRESRHSSTTAPPSGSPRAGTDTGSSQFFVNHTSNLHLDGRITIVAEVVAGWTSSTASRWATRSCQPRHSDPDVSEAVEQGTAVWYAAPGEMGPP
jgi:hypothetical protein